MGICNQACSDNKNSRKKKVISQKEKNNSYNVSSSKNINSVNILPTKVNNNFQNEVSSQKKQENKTLISKSFLSLYSSKNKKEKNILFNSINEEESNNSFSESIDSEEENYHNFFKETKYEKELNSNFKYFNVFWYDPNKTNDLTNFINCFENVQCFFSNDLESAINLFKKQSIFEWIVITPGKKGEELIYNLQIFENIKAFFIFCGNIMSNGSKNIIKFFV